MIINPHSDGPKIHLRVTTPSDARAGGQQRKAAALLGVKPTTLNSKMKRYGMTEGSNIDYENEEGEDIEKTF